MEAGGNDSLDEPIERVPAIADASSGVSGTQQPAPPEVIAFTPPPIEGIVLPRTVMGVVARTPESYGGKDMAAILGAVINDSTHDKEQARSLLAAKQAQLDEATHQLNAQKLQCTKLEERLDSLAKLSVLQRVCSFFSPMAFTLAYEMLKTNVTWAVLATAFGLVLLSANLVRSKGKE